MTVVRNVTRGTALATQAAIARNPWTRLVGLMGRAHLPAGTGLVFPGVQGVHTHFMRFAIDLVFYDGNGAVVDVVEGLRPWRFSPYRRHAKGVIELPAGTLRASQTQRGDRLSIG